MLSLRRMRDQHPDGRRWHAACYNDPRAMNELTAIILAAGEGERMRSQRPKVLHQLCGRPLIAYPVAAARDARRPRRRRGRPRRGRGAARRRPRGRGHVRRAARAAGHRARRAAGARGLRRRRDAILVLPGDMPLLSETTLERLVEPPGRPARRRPCSPPSVERSDGLRARGARGRSRVAHRRASRRHDDEKRAIRRDQHQRVLLRRPRLWPALAEVQPDNDAGRVLPHRRASAILRARRRTARGRDRRGCRARALGVNDRKQLAELAAIMRRRILDRLMADGRDRDRSRHHVRRRHRDDRRRHRALSRRDPGGPRR